MESKTKILHLDICFYREILWNVLSHIQEDLEESDLPFKVDLIGWSEWVQNFKN